MKVVEWTERGTEERRRVMVRGKEGDKRGFIDC
jgi:hypothetical protein